MPNYWRASLFPNGSLGEKIISIGLLFQLQYYLQAFKKAFWRAAEKCKNDLRIFFRPIEVLIFVKILEFRLVDPAPLNKYGQICWAKQGLPFCPLVT